MCVNLLNKVFQDHFEQMELLSFFFYTYIVYIITVFKLLLHVMICIQCITLSLAPGGYTINVSLLPFPYILETLWDCNPKPEACDKLIYLVFSALPLILCPNNWAHMLFSTPSLVPLLLNLSLFDSWGLVLLFSVLFPHWNWTSVCPCPVLSLTGILGWDGSQRFFQIYILCPFCRKNEWDI